MGQLYQAKLMQWLYMREWIDLKRKRIETVEEEAGKGKDPLILYYLHFNLILISPTVYYFETIYILVTIVLLVSHLKHVHQMETIIWMVPQELEVM